MRLLSAFVSLFLSLLAGCLTGGPPPTGRQLSATTKIGALAFYPRAALAGRTDAATLLVAEGDQQWTISSLIDSGDPDVPSTTHALFGYQPGNLPCLSTTASLNQNDFCRRDIDSRGRLVLGWYPPDIVTLTRIDPLTGQVERLSATGGDVFLSDSGQRLVYSIASIDPMDSTRMIYETHLREADDSERVLGKGIVQTGFVGEDLYLIDGNQTMLRLPPGEAPQTIAADIRFFTVLTSSDHPTFLIQKFSSDRTGPQSDAFTNAYLDPVAGLAVPFPPEAATAFAPFPSPDGQWALLAFPDETTPGANQDSAVGLLELATGKLQMLDVHASPSQVAPWRPGTHEAWLVSDSPPGLAANPRFWIVKPDAPSLEVGRTLQYHQRFDDTGNGSPFTDDGAYFFSATLDANQQPSDNLVVPAGDPESPGVALTPKQASSYFVAAAPGGSLLAQSYYVQQERSNLVLVDPASGSSRTLALAGALVALGQTRLLALQDCAPDCDLTVVDLATGATTRLAGGVTEAVVDSARGAADRLAAGTRVAFIVRGPYATPYDGLWLTTLP